MRIPVLSVESKETLVRELVNNQGGQVFQRLLELASENPVLYSIIQHLGNLFSQKEDRDNAVLSIAAIIWIIEAELERTEIESWEIGEEE